MAFTQRIFTTELQSLYPIANAKKNVHGMMNEFLNKIDDAFTQILLLRAEIECKKAKGFAWSPLLANAEHTVIAAKWHLSAVLNSRLQIQLMVQTCAISLMPGNKSKRLTLSYKKSKNMPNK